VLADLIAHVGSVVSTDRLIDDLWGSEPPATADAVLQNAISRLRKSLGPTAIARVAPGYVLTVDPGSIDGHRFERLVRDARPLPPQERARALRDALALWRGRPFMELTFATFLDVEIARLEELRLVALELTLEAEIELGLYDAAAVELAALAAEAPARERLRRLQMLALHRSGRSQDALDVYEHMRRAMDEHSGLEPGAETKALQLMILRDDPAIAAPTAVVPTGHLARRLVAVLAAKPVSTIAADLEAAATLVTATREALAATVGRHGGHVAPLPGSETFALFGVDGAREDDVLRAGRAAIEAREMLKSRGVPVGFALGIGRVLVEDGKPLLVGNVVDDVQRAVGAARPDEIVVVESAVHSGQASFTLGDADGRVTLVDVRPGRISRSRRPMPPFVGRADELARLDNALRVALSGESAVHVVVVGDAGIGKTRLVDAFAARSGVTVLGAACVPYGEGITFLPLLELADQAARLDSAAPRIEEVATAEAAFGAALGLVQHLMPSGPLLLVLDDLHWAVPTFLDLIEYLVSASRGPLVVVSLGRPTLLLQRPNWASHALVLEPLRASDARRLAEGAPGADELDDDVVAAIVETGAGVPLFIEQLTAFAREAGTGPSSIPPSLDAALASRLDALAPGELRVLEHAAVLGATFDRKALTALSERDAPSLDGRLSALEQGRLLQPLDDRTLGFGHALIRDAAYDGIPKVRRASLHERAARHLDRVEQSGSAATFHLEAAALLTREVGTRRADLAREAGHRLGAAGFGQWRGGDAGGAANLLERAVTILEPDDPLRLDVCVELALALRDLGQHDRAAAVLAETRVAAGRLRRRRIERRVDVESIVPGMSAGPGAGRTATAVVDAALPVFRRARDDRALGRTLLVRAFLASIGCRFAEAADAAEEAFACLERAGYSSSRAVLVQAAAGLHGDLSIAEARARCEELRERAEGWALAQANVDEIRSLIEVVGGEAAHARMLHAEAVAVFEERGQQLLMLTDGAGVAAEIEILSGDLERAAEILERAGADLERRGELAWSARHHILQAEVVLAMGDAVHAAELASKASSNTPQADVHATVTCLRVTAMVSAAAGDALVGRRLVGNALALLEDTDALELRSRVLVDAVEIERMLGRGDDLQRAIDLAAAAAVAKGSVLMERRLMLLSDGPEAEPPESLTPRAL